MLMLLYTAYCRLLLPFSTQRSSSIAGMYCPGLQHKCRVRIAAAVQALVRAVSVLPGELATLPWFGLVLAVTLDFALAALLGTLSVQIVQN